MPTGQQIKVTKASITLGYDSCARPKTIQGRSSIFLDDYKRTAWFAVDPATVKAGERASFPLPGPLNDCKRSKTGSPGHKSCLKKHLEFHLHQPTHSRIVQVDAYIDGKHVKRVKGHRVTTITLKRPKGKDNFVVKIVARAANGQRNISVRTYHRCTKTEPKSHSVRP